MLSINKTAAIAAVLLFLRMTKLSININKIATLRNSRGGNNPDLIKVALDAERFGAQGITVHPRPDERHIRYRDVFDLKKAISTEFNIEGNPTENKFIGLVLANKPAQVTLVPDAEGQLTSNHGWDTIKHQSYLKEIITEFKKCRHPGFHICRSHKGNDRSFGYNRN